MRDISINDLKKIIIESSWKTNGDSIEQKHGYLVTDIFPNLELLWKYFVVPSTGRVHNETNFVRQPETIDSRIVLIGNRNYVIFLHLVKCYFLVNNNTYFDDIFAIDDFYSHLVTVLDNFEQLVEGIFLLISEFIPEVKPLLLNKLEKKDFLKKMADFYEENYGDLIEQNKTKGHFIVNLQKIDQGSLLKQFFGNKELRRYSKFSQEIRQTRNLYIHGVRIGNIVASNKVILQPMHSKILEYRDDYRKVFNAINDPTKLNKDFVVARQQMEQDLKNAKTILNSLYKHILGKVDTSKLPSKFFSDLYSLRIVKTN